MPSGIVDERTLAGWLGAPTEARSSTMLQAGTTPLIYYADVEEHVLDATTGITKRCDITLRSKISAVATAEAKRPEVADVADPALQADAWKKAVARGLPFFLTINFNSVAAWLTEQGPYQLKPEIHAELAPGLRHSGSAVGRRAEISTNWRAFLDDLELALQKRLGRRTARGRTLPPQAADLQEVITHTAQEAALRIQSAASDSFYRDTVLTAFRAQFGVELSLDPRGNSEQLVADAGQVAAIGCFVVSTRLMLYQALSSATGVHGALFNLDALDILRTTSDPQRVARDLSTLYEHARRKTGDFEIQFSPSVLDDIIFVEADDVDTSDVGARWGRVIDVIRRSDWQSPASYVPGLYESLLDEEHRHVMGVHYTPDAVAEIIASYVVRSAKDVVLDPASGAGTFVTMCYERKRSLGSTHDQALSEVYAVELADFAASLTGLNLTLADSTARSAYPRVFRSDFFLTYPGLPSGMHLPNVGDVPYPSAVDGVVGNPPYVRFENRTPAERREIFKFLERHQARTQLTYPDFTGKADIWAFFIAGAQMYLRPGGRLGFVVSWNLLASDYGDAVLAFLGRYFAVDAIIDSRIERWFAAKQNTLILLARKLEEPDDPRAPRANPHLPGDQLVRFVRLKQPINALIDVEQPRGKQAEDIVDIVLAADADVGEDLRWDIRVFNQRDLVAGTLAANSTHGGGNDGE